MQPVTTDDIQELRTLRRAAITAGLAVLAMALTVPLVEFYIFPKLIDYKNAAQTAANISGNKTLFAAAIFIHFLSVVCDIVSAWALYIFLKPVNKNLSLLVALFRIVNTAFTIAALANLVQVLSLLNASGNLHSISISQVQEQVLLYIKNFNLQWRFMLIFFGIYMLLLGWLALHAKYIPKIISICILIAGAGYLGDDLKFFFYPKFDTGFLWFTYFGELIFMLWLLFKGSRLAEIKRA